ncbi:alpha/beta hydrolase [Streptomyces thermodiastaticus]|uniref:alpha/beta hydrolase n=1 Tax=Streptomyces thermodiastaticus TaxID=44061 RepID=UPI001F442A53|nr:alpha/beta hydrolase [Streptomyces thermodiastaticus]MCE7551678.1 alpha/beta hydrolase family protein [Streptomyces thermodiastaticus]
MDEERTVHAVADAAARNGGVRARRATRRGPRWWRALLAALVATAVVVPLSAAARPQVPAPAPAAVAAPSRTTLQATYAAHRADAARAARWAAAHGDARRAAAERRLAAPGRRLLAFDGRGPGLVTEVFGDLTRADRVAVLVPGSDTSLDTYDRFRADASALSAGLARHAPGRTAVVAWLGYRTPGTVSTTVLTTGRAEQAAPRLRRTVHELRGLLGGTARLTLVCHSYGSVVCGRAAARLPVDDIVLVGSPGTGAGSVAGLHTPARVWAGRTSGDWVAHVPHVRAALLGTTVGFGTDPMDPAFGARTFPAGPGGHSSYFTPGSACLAHLAGIVLGTEPTAPGAAGEEGGAR